MADLEEFQFELDNYQFGIDLPISVNGDGFDPGTSTVVGQDQQSPYGDTTFFGKDRLEGPTWSFEMHTDSAREPDEALAAKRQLAKIWRGDKNRRTQRSVIALRYRIVGETRRCYGRPRNWAAAPDNAILSGMLPIVADFKLVEPYCYTDVPNARTLTAVPATGGGFVFDLTFPISTAAGEARVGMLSAEEVGGDTPAPFNATIRGPVTNPWLSMGSWKIQVIGVVAHDQSVTISTYPWDLKAVRSDGVPMQLSPQTKLSSSLLSDQGGEIKFGGTSLSGTSRVDLSWRSRWIDW